VGAATNDVLGYDLVKAETVLTSVINQDVVPDEEDGNGAEGYQGL